MILSRPVTKEELFNLHHAQLCNVIEHIFGVLKQKFQILLLPVEYNLARQARLPAALCAIHNFIRDHDPEINDPDNDGADVDQENYQGGGHFEAEGLGADNAEGAAMRDRIAQDMWEDYQNYLQDNEQEEGRGRRNGRRKNKYGVQQQIAEYNNR